MKLKLKGGSLSGTYLIQNVDGRRFVRKEVSLTKNREYGYNRWYSQLKRMQRYEILFPGMFPLICGYGVDGDMAYYDMEYMGEKSINAYHFLKIETNKEDIKKFCNKLIKSMHLLHDSHFPLRMPVSSLELYFHQEVSQKLYDCQSNLRFWDFLKHKEIILNGEAIPSLFYRLDEFKKVFMGMDFHVQDGFTHGNLTLENILYNPGNGAVTFIDPYEENIIDSKICDYSQILQSCHSKYEMYNETTPVINGNTIEVPVPENAGIAYFNKLFLEFLGARHHIIDLFEISQFVRMLPFKMNVDENKMFLFYAIASKKFNDFMKM